MSRDQRELKIFGFLPGLALARLRQHRSDIHLANAFAALAATLAQDTTCPG